MVICYTGHVRSDRGVTPRKFMSLCPLTKSFIRLIQLIFSFAGIQVFGREGNEAQ